MTIDEAISHAREVADKNRKNKEQNTIIIPNRWADSMQCAEEHEQLAEWLEEYKTLRAVVAEIYDERQAESALMQEYEAEIRADVIDEYNKLIHKLDEDFTKENPKDGSTLYFWLGRIDKIAEKLKDSK